MVSRLVLSLTAAAALSACDSGDVPSGDSPARRADRAPSAGGRELSEDLDLQAMLRPVPAYEGQGRNLFDYGPVRAADTARGPTEPAPRPTPRDEDPGATASGPRPAPPPRPNARLNVKYAGFVEKTALSGGKEKYAIFLDGNEILTGAEGETVGDRFTVVEIGLESVTISAAGSNDTQRIPLQAN